MRRLISLIYLNRYGKLDGLADACADTPGQAAVYGKPHIGGTAIYGT